MDRGVYGRYRTDLPLLRPADMDQPLRLGLAAGISVCSALLLMLFRMSKNLLLCGVQRDLIGPLPFNCRCLSRLLQVGAELLRATARRMTPSTVDYRNTSQCVKHQCVMSLRFFLWLPLAHFYATQDVMGYQVNLFGG